MTGRKRGEEKIQKFEYLEDKKSFLDEINLVEMFFIDFEGLSFGEKYDKRQRIQALMDGP